MGSSPSRVKKNYKIGICCLSVKQSAQTRKERRNTVRFILKIASVYIVIKTTISMPKVCVNNIKCSLNKAMPLINIHFVY